MSALILSSVYMDDELFLLLMCKASVRPHLATLKVGGFKTYPKRKLINFEKVPR